MKRELILSTLLVVAATSLSGCASDSSESVDASGAATDSDLTPSQRQAQLNGLRPRVTRDFTNVQAQKLVFNVRRLKTIDDAAFIEAVIMKRDASGRDSDLSQADLEGSVYGDSVREGLFDGPVVFAVLRKKGETWSLATNKAGQEAYDVGPTEVPWLNWEADYNLPASLLP